MGINFLHEVHEGKLKNRGFFEHSEPTTENFTVYQQVRPRFLTLSSTLTDWSKKPHVPSLGWPTKNVSENGKF